MTSAFWLLMQVLLLTASVPLIVTGIKALGVTGAIAPIHYYMTAYVYGVLAARIRDSEWGLKSKSED